MKYKFWILVIVFGGILMIIGNATGSAFYTFLLEFLIALGIIGPEFIPLVSAIMIILYYIALFGGYSVLVAVFLILIKFNRLGRIIITVATSFGLLGFIIYLITSIVGYFGWFYIFIDPTWQTILDGVSNLFLYNSGIAFAGTAIAVVGKSGLKGAEKADKEEVED